MCQYKEIITPNVVIDEEKRAIIVHKDYSLNSNLLREPLRNDFAIETFDIKSFVDLMIEYKNETTKLFFSDNKIQGIVDFNTPEKGSFRNRNIILNLTKNTFYEAFDKSLKTSLTQREFITLLKSLYPFITKIDGKACDNMDVIEMAESLQAVKKFDSVQKNHSSKITLDVEIKSGDKKNLTLPRHIEFGLPVYECSDTKGEFETELFIDIDNEKFSLMLTCFTQPIVEKEVLEKIVKEIKEALNDVNSYNARS